MNNNIKIPLMMVTQPIGTFYIGKISASKIINNLSIKRRDKNNGIQRKLIEKRVNEIKEYSNDKEATFPTPIIISIDKSYSDNLAEISQEFFEFNYSEKEVFGEILDGQHRIEGLKYSKKINEFELIVILMFDLTEEEKAYIFTTINSNQRSVPKSLIYDLFELSEKRSPYKTCHEIARLLNDDDKSPFCNRLKMLGIKKSSKESLSQGAFVNELVTLISKNPEKDMRDIQNDIKLEDDEKLPLRYYFINDKDHIIYKIILNMFKAISRIFKDEWDDNEKYVLMRAIGYGAIMKSFPFIYNICKRKKNLTEDYFLEIFEQVKLYLDYYNIELNFEQFEASGKGQNKLKDIIEKALKEF